MARRITGVLAAITLGCILVLLVPALPARASEPNPYHYWASARLNSEGRWSHVCDVRGDALLWSETSLDSPSEIWLLDIASGARSLIFRSELPVPDLWAPAPYAKVWGDYVAYTSIGPDAVGPYYADYELFLVCIRPEGERVRLSQRDGVTISELEIDDGYVAWVEEQEDRSDLYLYSINTKEVEQVASEDAPGFGLLVAMGEGRMSLTKGASLYLYDIASSTNVLVAQGAEYVTAARISGNRLAWDQDGALWLRDLSTGTTVKVADDVGGFDLSAERLVWSTFEYLEGDGGVQGDVYLKEFPGGVVARLTNDDELDLAPQVSDHWVVWLRGNVKGGELTAYDLATGRTSTVAPYAYGFRLDGDRIGWYEYRSKGDAFLAQAHRFSDVPPNHPLYPAIEDLARRGIVTGFRDGNFWPSGPLTRQQFAKTIVKTLGLTVTGNESCPFVDVDSGMDPSDPFYPDKYVAVCALNGITQGKTPTTFAPYDNITRAQLLTMVVRAAAQMGILDDPSPAYYLGTSDGTHFFRTWDDPDHALNAQTAEFNGLLDGLVLDDSSSLPCDPYKTATRGEVAHIMWRLLQKMDAKGFELSIQGRHKEAGGA